MAFDLDNFDKLSAAGNPNVRKVFGYYSASDALATISASAYFNDVDNYLSIGDDIMLAGSDGYDRVRVTAISPNVTVTTEPDVAPGSITNTEIAANAAIAFSKLATLASGNILVGSVGGVATSVAMSGDATIIASGALTIANSAINNAKVDAAAAIDFSKLAALPSAQILVGSAGNVATAVAMSGDTTISNAGAVTLGAVVNAAKASTYVPEAVIAGMPVLHVFNMAAGATATRTITTSQKITVVDAWCVLKGLGTAADTIQVKNAAGTAITNAMDINVADTSIVRAGTIDDAQRVVAAAANLQCTITDGGGADVPAVDVYVLCYVTP